MTDLGWLALINLVLLHLLPAGLGILSVRFLLPLTGPGRHALHAGLGLAMSLPLAVCSIHLADIAGGPISASSVTTFVVLAGGALAVLAWSLRRVLRPAAWHALDDGCAAAADGHPWARWLLWLLVCLVALRLLSVLPDLFLRPVFPWDAWKLWAWKAKVWFESGALVPLLPGSEWLTADGHEYVVEGVNHPDFTSLLMLYSAVALDSWDDSLVGMAWLIAGISAGFMIHGTLRHLGAPAVLALAGVYLLFSVPMVSTHLALFGYADLLVMLYFLVFCVGLVLWVRHRGVLAVVIMLAGAAMMALTKDTGVYWVPVLGLAWLAASLSNRILLGILALGGVLIAVLAAFGFDPLFLLTSGRYTLDGQASLAALAGMARHLFIWLDWHLVWYLFPFILLLTVRYAGCTPELRALLVLVVLALAYTLAGFMLTRATEYAVQGTLFSRVMMQFYPAVVLLAVLALWRWLRRVDRGAPEGTYAAG